MKVIFIKDYWQNKFTNKNEKPTIKKGEIKEMNIRSANHFINRKYAKKY